MDTTVKNPKENDADAKEKTQAPKADQNLDGCAKPFVAEAHRLDDEDDACYDSVQ